MSLARLSVCLLVINRGIERYKGGTRPRRLQALAGVLAAVACQRERRRCDVDDFNCASRFSVALVSTPTSLLQTTPSPRRVSDVPCWVR